MKGYSELPTTSLPPQRGWHAWRLMAFACILLACVAAFAVVPMVLHGKPWPVEGPQGPPAAVGKHHYKPHYTNVHFSVPYGVALCSEGEHVDCDLSKTKDFIQHALDQRFGPGTAFLPELRFRMATAAMVPDAAHEPDGVRDGGGSDGDNDDGPSPPDDGPPPPSNEEKGCHVMWETSMADKTIGSGVLLSMMPGHGTVSLGDFTLDSTAVGTLSICDSESWHSAGCGDVHLTGNLEGEVLVDAIRLMPAGEVRSVVETVREAMRAVMETA